MQCPKCGAEQSDAGNAICDRCGIVFEKYFKYHPRSGTETSPPVRIDLERAEPSGLRGLVLPAPKDLDWLGFGVRAVLFLVLFIWGWLLMLSSIQSNAAGESILHLVNLPFHEAGHVFLRPFGQFMMSLGGTLGQLAMPLVCAGVLLLKTQDAFGASVALWWFGENFLDIAPYIADARAGQLPLLGGNVGHSAPYGFHDWEYLLTESDLLHLDLSLARASHFTGSLIMVLALVWGAVLLYRQLGHIDRL